MNKINTNKKASAKKTAKKIPAPVKTVVTRPIFTTRERSWLIRRPDSDFLGIKACYDIVNDLYIRAMNTLDAECQHEGDTVEELIRKLIRQTKAARGKLADKVQYDIYYLLFRKAENTVRTAYFLWPTHDTFFYDKENKQLETLLGRRFHAILKTKAGTVPVPETGGPLHKKLNKVFPYRWHKAYDEIIEGTNEINWQNKLLQINTLALPLQQGAYVEEIFFKASKLFADYDRQAAVSFYLQHLHAPANDKDKRAMQKVTASKLFSSARQLEAFRAIVANLIETKDIEAALAEVPFIYKKKYQKIELNPSAINTVTARHSKTVSLLNRVLAEEEEMFAAPANGDDPPATAPMLNKVQIDLLTLFRQNNFFLDNNTVDGYAQSHGVFKNQLIDSINDRCYDTLDDVLVEQAGEGYEILEKYFHIVMSA